MRVDSAPPPGSAWQAVTAFYESAEIAVVTLARLVDAMTGSEP